MFENLPDALVKEIGRVPNCHSMETHKRGSCGRHMKCGSWVFRLQQNPPSEQCQMLHPLPPIISHPCLSAPHPLPSTHLHPSSTHPHDRQNGKESLRLIRFFFFEFYLQKIPLNILLDVLNKKAKKCRYGKTRRVPRATNERSGRIE